MLKLLIFTLGLFGLASQAYAAHTVKVMPFGASIVSVRSPPLTYSSTQNTNISHQRCWRANLQTKLKAASIKNFDFVGSQTGSCAGTAIDQDHEGHPGSLAVDYAKNGNLTVWLDKNPPDVIIMLLGTNDVLIGKKPVADILAAYDVLLDQMRRKNERMQIVFSNLLPLDPERFGGDAVQGIKDLNAAIATYAPKKGTLKSPVYFVDQFTGFDPAKDTDDGEHPNLQTGVEKMAVKFLDATKTAITAAGKGKAVRRSGTIGRRI
jgi:lysophospholipase L1-like esterase